ncbi:MAG: ribonuclease J, partial [Alphaproteobacteria bacterium]|nr:ribonuclease J [Alphaproteobacteria bacterium]
KVYSAEEAKDIPADNAMYICTGSQANYRSALMSIANGESKYVKIDASDTVIFSSKVIPGNEARIERLQDKFEETGAKVITDETALVHASGHANRDDLKKMYDLLKPAIVLPVHGDKKFIREHKRFALTCGVNDVFSARNGEVCLLRDKSIEKIAEVPTDILAWDRNHPVSLGSDVIKNRRRIAYNCSLFIGVLIKEAKVADLQISSIDILEEKAWEELSSRIAEEVRPLIDKKLQESDNKSQIEDFIRGQIRRRVFQATEIKPVTFLQMFFA